MKPQTDEPQDPPEPHEPPAPLPKPQPPAGLTLVGTNGNDLLVGSSGADVIYGLDGDDLLHGGAGDDLIYGGAGSDVLVGNAGADRLDGGAGVDFVSYAWSPSTWGVSVDLALGRGFRGDAEGDTYFGIEDLMGSQYHDLLAGTADNNSIWGHTGNDTIYGRAGDDYLYGGEGDDVLDGGAGEDWLEGGAGEDTVTYFASTAGVAVNLAIGTSTGAGVGGDAADNYLGIENVEGSAFADVLIGGAGDNKLWGNGGNDQLTGGAGNDQLHGGDGHDALRGGAGADYLSGGAGTDTVYYQDSSAGVHVDLRPSQTGFYGDAQGDSYYGIENAVGSSHGDSLTGSAGSNDLVGLGGNDTLHGLEGNDRLLGGEGHDDLYGGAGADRLDGGNGVDYVRYDDDSAVSGVTVNLATGVGSGGHAAGDTYFGIENVEGSTLNDFLIGNAGNNYLYGEDGNDTLIGGAGQDTLEGGPGRDILTGDGNGIIAADTFVLKHTNAVITDFQQGVDKIRMRDQFTLQDFGTDGELAWGTIGDTHALDASDKYFFDTSSNTLYECDFSTGTLALHDAVVTINADVPRLQTSDFLLV